MEMYIAMGMDVVAVVALVCANVFFKHPITLDVLALSKHFKKKEK